MRSMLAAAALLVALPAPAPAPAQETPEQFAALREVDMRLAGIAWRLATANRALCRDLAPVPGIAIHAIDQYDPKLRAGLPAIFGFEAPVAVEGVVPNSAAARAGVRPNEGISAVAGQALAISPAGRAQASSATRDAAAAVIARQPADAPLALTLVQGGRTRTVTVPPSPGCRSRFEVLVGPGLSASADGDIVQIGVRFFERFDDDMIAVVVAHEFAHNILKHRERLDAAGIKRGLLSEFGRNGRLFRQTENQADLLGMHLLRNAGWDPALAVRFWREHGGEVDGGLFRSRTHPSSKARGDAVAAEIAAIPAGSALPYLPPVLAERDKPLN